MDILKAMAVMTSGGILVLVIELIRRGRLKERYSLLWILAGVVLLTLSSSRSLLDRLAGLVGIHYPPSLIFLLAFVFLLLITLHFSVAISRLSDQNRQLAQEIARLRLMLDDQRRQEGSVRENG